MDPESHTQKKHKGFDRFFGFVEGLPLSDRFIFKTLLLATVMSVSWFLYEFNTSTLVRIPKDGGTLIEGIIGTPRFINPLLAVTNADKDTMALIYAGLMRLSEDGTLVPDLAESVVISNDGLTYNITLRNDLAFHDGTPLTSDDVIFTIARIQDPALKSPLQASWEGVRIERIGEREFNFVLDQPYIPFIENLTLGVLPKHIWDSASMEELPFSQYNSEPIGSGPYRVEKIVRNSSGIPESYTLTPFEGYHGTTPRIQTLKLVFFQNEEALVSALEKNTINSAAGLSPESIDYIQRSAVAMEPYNIYTSPLPRTFAVFFNQNEEPLFRDDAVREALNIATPRERIVAEVLGGYGSPIYGPIPPGFSIDPKIKETIARSSTSTPIEQARKVLRDGGWRFNEENGVWQKGKENAVTELRFSLATVNTPSFQRTAEILQEAWGELGAVVDVKKFEQTDLTQTLIRPRKYKALLFGTVVGRELDFFSFWHSSQRNDPGLNVALYANITTDSILADVRSTAPPDERDDAYRRFAEEITSEIPAIFLYVPSFIYVAPASVENIHIRSIASPHERFSGIQNWFIETEHVWQFFARKAQHK